MNILLKVEMITLSIIILFLITYALKNKNMSVKYSIVWLIIPMVFLGFTIFSEPMITLANKIGFEKLSNLIFCITFAIIFTICFSLTIIVSNLKKRIVLLTQEISILRKEINKK